MYKRRKQGWLKHIDFVLLDAIVLQFSFLFACLLKGTQGSSHAYKHFAITLFLVDILVSAIFNTMHNVLKRGLYRECEESFKQSILVLVVMSLYMFFTQSGEIYSRIVICLTAFFHFVFGYISRKLWRVLLLKLSKHRQKAKVILVADEKDVRNITEKINFTDEFAFEGLVLHNRDATGECVCGIKVVANIYTAADYICREWVDEIFISPITLSHTSTPIYESIKGFFYDDYGTFAKTQYQADFSSKDQNNEQNTRQSPQEEINVLIEQCRQMSIPIHIMLPISNISDKSFIEKFFDYTVLTITSNYVTAVQLAVKRSLDILGGLVGSFIALIIIAVVAPIIKKESPGPILFKQTRIGQNGKKFQIYKIRSMYMDAEERKKELVAQNRVKDGLMFKLDWDPRIIGNKIVNGKKITGIGEYLRSHSLDEFPQFFNVLRNQMSLVGTRPPTVDEWEKYRYHHRARLATKPGITGMWQVSGRSKITDFEEIVQLDTEYIQHWSIGLDFRILIRTVKAVLNKDGAM